MVQETVLITGASSGIGWEFARLFAGDRCDLVLVARRERKLQMLAEDMRAQYGVQVWVRPVDLSRPDQVEALCAGLDRDGITVDVLVNNAGFGLTGPFSKLDWAKQRALIDVNVTAVVQLTRLLLPGMQRRNRGGVLNVASTAAFQPGPFMAVYYATKAFVLSFSEALVEEVAGSDVRISCLCPGLTDTEFVERSAVSETRLSDLGAMDASTVALAGYRGFRRGAAVVVPGFQNKVGAFGVRLMPRSLVRKVVRYLQQKPE